MQHLQPNTLLHGGTYKIIKMLGQGSFGITYLAVHTNLDKKVAIKEFFMKELNSRNEDGSITGMSDGSLSYDYCQKFQKESLNLSRLDHPNIVRVTDSFEDNGTFYYVMDYIEGMNLNEYIKQYSPSEKKAIEIIRSVAEALIYMHEQKHMLHLDLKPGNIMRRKGDGHIFLIDFGLSKHYSTDGQPETSTTIGLGTAGYAPVEQGNRAKNGEFRPTIDVYALGATLYKLVIHETPPVASDLIDEDALPELLKTKGVSEELSSVIINAMMPSVKKRISSVRAFVEQLPNTGYTSNASTYSSTVKNEETIVANESGEKTKLFNSAQKPVSHPNSTEASYQCRNNKPKVAAANTTISQTEESKTMTEEKSSGNSSWKWVILLLVIIGGPIVYCIVGQSNNPNTNAEMPEVQSTIDNTASVTTPSENVTEENTAKSYQENHDQEIKDFIQFFYSAYVFGNYDFDPSKVSSSVQYRLQNDYEYEGGGYAVWDFRTGVQDGPDGESKITSITSMGDGWYKVTMLDCGVNGTKRIKVDYNNGNMQIVDFN